MSEKVDPIAAALAAAKSAAETPAAQASASPAASVPAVASAPAAVVAARPNTPLSAADMMSGSFSVDVFAKVSEDGIKIGDSSLIEGFRAKIDLTEVFYYFGVRYGNPAVYEKTTDRLKSLTGKNWGDVLAQASKVDGAKFRGEYRAADIPMVALENVKDVKGKVAAEADTRVGKSLSTTEWREWEQLIRTAMKRGLNVDSAIVEVKVGFKGRSNKEGNKWGVLTFELVGEYQGDVAEAA